MKVHLVRFNKENMTIDDQDETIMLFALSGGIQLKSPMMVELVRKTTTTLHKFMDKTVTLLM